MVSRSGLLPKLFQPPLTPGPGAALGLDDRHGSDLDGLEGKPRRSPLLDRIGSLEDAGGDVDGGLAVPSLRFRTTPHAATQGDESEES